MIKKIAWLLVVILAVTVASFPFIFYVKHIEFGIVSEKSSSLLRSFMWQFNFHTHIIFAALALLTGWVLFIKKVRIKYPIVHKNLGKFYIICSLVSAAASIYIGFFATGGVIAKIGFISLACVWIYSNIRGYDAAIHFNITKHRDMMTYSYAACFAGVTLRLEMPLLLLIFKDFVTAYIVVAWLCWVPNIAVAYMIGLKK